MKLPSASLTSYALECILLLFVLLVIVEAIVEILRGGL